MEIYTIVHNVIKFWLKMWKCVQITPFLYQQSDMLFLNTKSWLKWYEQS
jgi:hypothetical protein